MLRTTKLMKDKFEKIQKYLFSMIPEKWEEIYLYASINQRIKGKKTGELYFYYLPKGILKKKPVNVYEIPQRFNINEDEYLYLVNDLYNCIKDLAQDFIDTEQPLWNSITISILNDKFKIEYDYDELPRNEEENNQRRIIWRNEYLGIGGEKKEERKILEKYYETKHPKRKIEIYETGLYLKTANNEISFDKEESKDTPKFEKEKKSYEKIINPEYQKEKERKTENKEIYNIKKEGNKNNKSNKNQILNM